MLKNQFIVGRNDVSDPYRQSYTYCLVVFFNFLLIGVNRVYFILQVE